MYSVTMTDPHYHNHMREDSNPRDVRPRVMHLHRVVVFTSWKKMDPFGGHTIDLYLIMAGRIRVL